MSFLWRIELFGKLHAQSQQQSISRFRTQKTGALLAYLAFYRERSHPRETLIDILWPEAEPDAGRHNLRMALSSLRHQFEPPATPEGSVLLATRNAVRLNPDAVTTDVAEFESLLKRATQAQNLTDKIALLAQTVALYQGSLLPGYYEAWILPQQLRLEDEYAQAMLELLRLLEQAGDLAQALRYGSQAVTLDPAREELNLVLMRLYAAADQPARALQQYHRLEQQMQEQWGEMPSAPARQLAHLLQERLSAASPKTPPSPSAPIPTRGLSDLAAGTVTFLLIGLAASTPTTEQDLEAVQEKRTASLELARSFLNRHRGQEIRVTEDGFCAAFPRADTALACAIAMQQGSQRQAAQETTHEVLLRIALHTGDVTTAPDGDQDVLLRHAGQILASGHGGQILCSEATAALIGRSFTPEVHLTNLGTYRLWEGQGEERLFQITYPEMPARRFPPLKAPPAFTGGLPPQATRFFGREADLARLHQRIFEDRTRLLTLIGPGGTGKTRLALEAAARWESEFQGAVWFVPLADLAEASLLPSAIRQALGVRETEGGDIFDPIVAALSERPALLVLDNFEHLVEEGASLVDKLLSRTPTLTCLITSRQRLALAIEREFTVSPLRTPEMSDPPELLMRVESVQLFVDRAQAVRPDFQVTRSNARAVAELCAHLEGIPLALELAAARIQVMSPAQMLGQLAHRLDFFISRQRDIAARHRTLRAALDWSYRLLSPELQRFLAQLAVFRGGWTAAAAEAVCGQPQALDYLEQLQDHSLLQSEEQDEEVRFRMLETVRQYAAEKLIESQEADDIERRRNDFFLALAEAAVSQINGPQQARLLAQLEREHDNLRAVLEVSVEHEEGLRLVAALCSFWCVRSHLSEGRSWAERALKHNTGAPIALRARALNGAGQIAYHQSDYVAARGFYLASLELRRQLGEKNDIAAVLNSLGLLAHALGDFTEARRYHEQSLALRRETGHTWGIAASLCNLGLTTHYQGELDTSRAYLEESLIVQQELDDRQMRAVTLTQLGHVSLLQRDYAASRLFQQESLELCREIGDQLGITLALTGLGNAAAGAGDYEAARAFHTQSLAISRARHSPEGIMASLYNLGDVARAQKDYAAAHAYYAECLAMDTETGLAPEMVGEVRKQAGIAGCLRAFAHLAAAQEQMERAAVLFGAAEAFREVVNISILPEYLEQQAEDMERARTALGEDAFMRAWMAGRALTREQAISLALGGRLPVLH